MTTTKLQAGDLGYWHWNEQGTVAVWRWRYRPNEIAVTDRVRDKPLDVLRARGTFHLSMREDPRRPGEWIVKSCGTTGKGATRYRDYLDLHEANVIALAWLNRRFKAEVLP
jgi:hypothetical protein